MNKIFVQNMNAFHDLKSYMNTSAKINFLMNCLLKECGSLSRYSGRLLVGRPEFRGEIVHIGSGAHPVSYAIATFVRFLVRRGIKKAKCLVN
jgi:hypothetical protein